jgi:Zn-dependent oligopeptidase
LLERLHLDFVLSGAKLPAAAGPARRDRRAARAATTRFSQNVLAEESGWCLWLTDERDLAGLPESARSAAKAAAVERGEPEAWAITRSRSLIMPSRRVRRLTCGRRHSKPGSAAAGDGGRQPSLARDPRVRTEQAR